MGRSGQEAGDQQVMLHATCHMPHSTPLARARALALSLSRSLARSLCVLLKFGTCIFLISFSNFTKCI
jgi:hypothetical protein